MVKIEIVKHIRRAAAIWQQFKSEIRLNGNSWMKTEKEIQEYIKLEIKCLSCYFPDSLLKLSYYWLLLLRKTDTKQFSTVI